MWSSVISVVSRLSNTFFLPFILCVSLIFTLAVSNVRPVAAQTTIEVLSCDGVTGSSLSITEPQSDSTVALSPVTVTGTVSQANQIEVYVDEVLSHIIPLPFRATEFSTTVSLSSGTHTLRLVALDLCQIQSATDTTIITYSPSVTPTPTPTPGSEVPTDVAENQPDTPPVSIKVPETPAGKIVDTIILKPFARILDFLDLTAPIAKNDAATLENSQRFVLGFSGAAFLVGAPFFSEKTIQLMHLINHGITATPRRLRIAKGTIIGIGFLLITLMFAL